ncbi:hypothetical protein EUGRSUZ_B01099 [Eucalyptus grandis]|uniref:Uncharacterized protein n=2 Tax=Eucalyptus grandis TaxID=71139 RepID=A0ACC3LPH1_EUCGR|nr:hypothetical protein EUGRSUZ_B01099 [Eucalyptus grandis]
MSELWENAKSQDPLGSSDPSLVVPRTTPINKSNYALSRSSGIVFSPSISFNSGTFLPVVNLSKERASNLKRTKDGRKGHIFVH